MAITSHITFRNLGYSSQDQARGTKFGTLEVEKNNIYGEMEHSDGHVT